MANFDTQNNTPDKEAKKIDDLISNNRINGGQIINDSKIGFQVMENWLQISDASVWAVKKLLIQYAQIQGTVSSNAQSGINALIGRHPDNISLTVGSPNNGVIHIEIKDRSSQKILGEFDVGKPTESYQSQSRVIKGQVTARMGDDFKEGSPKYVKVLTANETEIKLKTVKPPEPTTRGGKGGPIQTDFDADLGEITLKTSQNDPFNKMEWMDVQLSNLGLNSRQLQQLEGANFGLDSTRRVAFIASASDSSFLIPTLDGSGFATICKGGIVHIYDKNNPIPSGGIARKPVIYLYPQKKIKISVSVELHDAQMVAEYPKLKDGKWQVEVSPRGNIIDLSSGKKYGYLFWEAEKKGGFALDTSKSDCVASKDIGTYLEKSLKTLGLNTREANDFIVYWLPVLEKNAYSLIEWKTTEYTDMAKLHISPQPDTLIRVFMVFKKSDTITKTTPQKLQKARRSGYSVIEWGGSNLDEGKNIK